MHTAPNSLPNLPSAPLTKRLLALSYDLFILLALSMAYSALATVAMVWLFDSSNSGDYMPMQNGPWFGLGWATSVAAFYWFFFKRAGQTVGMRAWRLKIVGADSTPPSHTQCWIRILIAPIGLSLGGIGYLWCLFNRDKLAWQDLASNTRVVCLPKATKK